MVRFHLEINIQTHDAIKSNRTQGTLFLSVSLLKDLHDAWCVISYNSSPGVVSRCWGVPVFVLDPLESKTQKLQTQT